MQLPDFGQLIANSDPILIFVAVFAGLIVFFLVRAMLRSLPLLFQLLIGIGVGLLALWLLQNVLR